MFEKEAEEYLGNFADCANCKERWSVCADSLDEYCLANGCCYATPKEQDIYIAGAEFGYNKANEWHYVKDGDLPKAYQKCYFIYSNVYGQDGKISFSKSDINVLTGVYAFFLDEETDEETAEPCFYDDINDDEICLKEVYAWKEIVLPKESE